MYIYTSVEKRYCNSVYDVIRQIASFGVLSQRGNGTGRVTKNYDTRLKLTSKQSKIGVFFNFDKGFKNNSY